ncbi:uncharacterized protein RSE6_00439 [Rhynchosporium secalis]|uniref:Uncharacterized protein n=1 Tax=Rhynchosporium secalis TaxID=38038 RepID=A0A1E1LVA1_RHYSE|nr:uncharacterized protein RSE6_00439 [Rhynchosporium secalis]
MHSVVAGANRRMRTAIYRSIQSTSLDRDQESEKILGLLIHTSLRELSTPRCQRWSIDTSRALNCLPMIREGTNPLYAWLDRFFMDILTRARFWLFLQISSSKDWKSKIKLSPRKHGVSAASEVELHLFAEMLSKCPVRNG